MSDFDDQMAEWRKTVWGTGPCPDSSQEYCTLTDEERDDITIWLAECLRQCSATQGLENGDVAERWRHRALRAGHMLKRLK